MELSLAKTLENVEGLLVSCVLEWKRDNDYAGYERFTQALEQLERMADRLSGNPETWNAALVSCLEELSQHIRNQDIIAIGDELEGKLIPLVREWRKEAVTTGDGQPG
ncbi:hypothetical protein [Cohnella laeviribosi]|uniref:hypothetical protein n=1 Tax=Cohnella laeviribosi TaxID=380174 RepID=UPI00036DC31E|nr:hypothetical protein [Cohnella laeviribosi]